MATHVFTKYEDEVLVISGEPFKMVPLPSGKAKNLSELTGDISKVFDSLTQDVSEETDDIQVVASIGNRILSARYKIFSFGLQVEEGTKDYARLEKAIDDASMPELFWAVDRLLEVNGIKHVEKLIKNLLSRLEPIIPDLLSAISASVRRFSETEAFQETINGSRRTGLTQSLEPSEESHTDSDPISLPTR